MLTPEQTTWAKRGGAALAVLLLLVLAFSAGRFSAPLQVQEREVEKLVYRDLSTEDITRGYTFTRVEQRTVYRNVVTTITVTPDAGTVTTTADNTVEHYGGQLDGAVTEQEARVELVQAEREVLVEKIATLRPDWRVGAQVGASLQPPALVIAGPLVLGASVERRILGGVSAGLWANTAGAGGASVSVEF